MESKHENNMQTIPQNLTIETLNNYALNFFGYGKWEAPIWLIGLEERGAAKQDEFTGRYKAWNNNKACLQDLRQYHSAAKIGCPQWNNKTWQAMHTICI